MHIGLTPFIARRAIELRIIRHGNRNNLRSRFSLTEPKPHCICESRVHTCLQSGGGRMDTNALDRVEGSVTHMCAHSYSAVVIETPANSIASVSQRRQEWRGRGERRGPVQV